ncbi:MAG: type II toxin-antitoxin system RelE/ParE family toxin [Phormidesmis sp.]
MNLNENNWLVIFHDEFNAEFDALSENVQDRLLAALALLKQFGPNLGRPHVDALDRAETSNLKELRFDASNGVWRVAFAFDPKRQAIILVAGDKKGENQKKFYKNLIKTADSRFNRWLAQEENLNHGNDT